MFASIIILVFAVVVTVLSLKKSKQPQVVARKIEFEGDIPTDFLEEPEFTVTSTDPQATLPAEEIPAVPPAEEVPAAQPATLTGPPATAPARLAERRRPAPAAPETSQDSGLRLDDEEKRKLIIYSEIMKPKFDR